MNPTLIDINKYTTSAINAIKDGWISNHGKFVELANNKIKEIILLENTILHP